MVARLWAIEIRDGRKSMDEVPEKLKAQVRKILEEEGWETA